MPVTTTVATAVARAYGFTGFRPLDPYFNQTVLLLHGDGTNGAQNNTFIDGSTNNFTITRNGNTTQGTFSPFSLPDGQWSNFFDGVGDSLSIPNNTAFEFSTGNFTVEAWIYLTSSAAGNKDIFLTGKNPGNFGFYLSGTQLNYVIQFVASEGGGTVPTNQWVHVACSRSSNTIRLFINGNIVFTGSRSNSLGSNFVGIGDGNFPGYISNVRVVKGTAVYTSNFTPPTTPLTAITNTSLLTCQSNRFVDNSSNNFAITRNGDVRVTAFSPFAPTAAYDAGTNGGSGYFDGSGDYLTVADNDAFTFTGDFTIEAWVYIPSLAAERTVVAHWPGGTASNCSFIFRINTSGFIRFSYGVGSSNIDIVGTTASVQINSWNHVAITRSGTTVRLFVNGSQDSTTGTISGSLNNSTASLFIGLVNTTDNVPMSGYIVDLRFVKGTALYTTAFTPPTAPLTAITNTSLLLNFTNAGIFDSTGKNVLETVGNAQIDTAVSKFGSGSMEFDGTGDWLLLPDNPDIQLGTGNFTIEMWVRLAAVGAARGLVAKGASTTGWLVSTNSSNNVVFTFGSSTITSTGTLAVNTWYHVSVVRTGTGTNQTRIYIDGVQDGQGTVSTDFNQTNVMYVGANRTGGDALNGFIDDLRITKGVARYTANFTPPARAFEDR